MFNRTRSLEADPGPPPPGRGPCHCYLYEQDPVVHDMLLGFERRGMAGIVELLDYVETAPDLIDSPISHLDIPDWAAEHRWEDPGASCASPQPSARRSAFVTGSGKPRRGWRQP